eukprot:1161982-Pelagomonas_calceolata.AAC.2
MPRTAHSFSTGRSFKFCLTVAQQACLFQSLSRRFYSVVSRPKYLRPQHLHYSTSDTHQTKAKHLQPMPDKCHAPQTYVIPVPITLDQCQSPQTYAMGV